MLKFKTYSTSTLYLIYLKSYQYSLLYVKNKTNKIPHMNYNINVIAQENYILHLLHNPKLQRILLVCETWIE